MFPMLTNCGWALMSNEPCSSLNPLKQCTQVLCISTGFGVYSHASLDSPARNALAKEWTWRIPNESSPLRRKRKDIGNCWAFGRETRTESKRIFRNNDGWSWRWYDHSLSQAIKCGVDSNTRGENSAVMFGDVPRTLLAGKGSGKVPGVS